MVTSPLRHGREWLHGQVNRFSSLVALSLLLALSPTLSNAGEFPQPTPDGIRIAMDTARWAVSWLVFTDGSRQEIAGKMEIKEPRLIFYNAAGTMFSVKLTDVDLAATTHFNRVVREGRWVDSATLAWSQARVRNSRTSMSDIWRQYLQMSDALDQAMDADVQANCGGYSAGTAQYFCGFQREIQFASDAVTKMGY